MFAGTALFSMPVFQLEMKDGITPSTGETPLITNASGEELTPSFRNAHLGRGLVFPAGTTMEIHLQEAVTSGSVELTFIVTSEMSHDGRIDILLTCDSFVLYLRQGLLYLASSEGTLYLPVYHWNPQPGNKKDLRDFVSHIVISWDTGKFLLMVDGREAIPSKERHHKISGEGKAGNGLVLGDRDNWLEFLLDGVAVFNTPFSQAEVTTRYQSILTKSILFKRSIVTIPMLKSAPVIDGNISDDVWRQATELSHFFAYKSRKVSAKPSPRIFIGYDRDALYIAFKSRVPDGASVEKVPRDDSRIVGQDTFEIFFRPTMTWEHDYYQLIVNAAGSVYDGKVFDNSWNGEFTYRTRVEDGSWLGEIKVPFSTFEGAGIPEPGDQWTFNICRNFRGLDEQQLSQWAHTGIAYHNAAGFAELRFGNPGERVREKDFSFNAGEYLNIHIDAAPELNHEKTVILYRAGEITPFKTVAADGQQPVVREESANLAGGVAEVVLHKADGRYPIYQRMFEF